ncbi:MAG: proton-conducting transporter membrane subunit [Lachnospiraceae bacterium]|nr:proton-conducting transporter membrane subunit [Lachnospiraceae bacterium]
MIILITILFPIISGIIISNIHMEDRQPHVWYAAAILITDLLGANAILTGGKLTLFSFTETVSAYFAVDGISRFFMIVVMLLFSVTCFYAFEYMKMEERENAFFAFYFICYGAMLAVCMAGNLVTLYLCFEMATLTSMPLVLHELTKDAVSAALKYLFYSIGGALLGLLSIFFVCYYSLDAGAFALGGTLDLARLAGNEKVMLAMAFVGIMGFGTKAGMYPMHGWLPAAHPIAPAPASALLSGIIAKAGIIAIIRLVYYSIGADFLRGTWVQYAWMTLCMLTIFMGSMMAFKEKVMKKRLAYSTISQISYISLGLALLVPEGAEGALLHVAAHATSKGCLFLAAGTFIYKLGKRNVGELKGIGKQLPITMWCFLFASLSLVGIPPMGGYVSKWYIALAAVGGGMGAYSILPPIILLVSALLTAGYLLPVVVDAFFPGHEHAEEAVLHHASGKRGAATSASGKTSDKKVSKPVSGEGTWQKEKRTAGDEVPVRESALMYVPMIILSVAALCVGIFGSQIAEAMRAFL